MQFVVQTYIKFELSRHRRQGQLNNHERKGTVMGILITTEQFLEQLMIDGWTITGGRMVFDNPDIKKRLARAALVDGQLMIKVEGDIDIPLFYKTIVAISNFQIEVRGDITFQHRNEEVQQRGIVLRLYNPILEKQAIEEERLAEQLRVRQMRLEHQDRMRALKLQQQKDLEEKRKRHTEMLKKLFLGKTIADVTVDNDGVTIILNDGMKIVKSDFAEPSCTSIKLRN